MGLFDMNWAEALYWIGQLLMKLATVMFIMLATILYVGQFIYTQVMVNIGFMVMPVMVPFIMLEKTRFIFDGWLRFMITAGFTKIVGAFLYGMMVNNINESVNIAMSATAGEQNQVAFYVYSAVLLLTGITAYIMAQAQTIGNSLVSGYVSGGFSFNPMRMSSNLSGGARQTGKSVASGANSAGGALRGMTRGFRGTDGSSGGVANAMRSAAAGAREGFVGGVMKQSRPTSTPTAAGGTSAKATRAYTPTKGKP